MSIPSPGIRDDGFIVGASKARFFWPPSIEGAVKDAYGRAKREKVTAKEFKVAEIYVRGTNPISEYVVVLQIGP
jgi:hypothetical protein